METSARGLSWPEEDVPVHVPVLREAQRQDTFSLPASIPLHKIRNLERSRGAVVMKDTAMLLDEKEEEHGRGAVGGTPQQVLRTRCHELRSELDVTKAAVAALLEHVPGSPLLSLEALKKLRRTIGSTQSGQQQHQLQHGSYLEQYRVLLERAGGPSSRPAEDQPAAAAASQDPAAQAQLPDCSLGSWAGYG
eukprot:CAMPEP_0117676594 /NCGR_PEP_ID=MMETSP0804-20121206/16258_1 /TAXON_ID=1074897 /ORGANISM="Tetraselmis astigmatica, Strain CCMP880" /LENGTH=191 /DNA_ID=CAMNT_0005485747 /DNA_START=92 /DNA_END=663 /DNA_ORIENTATION=+